MGLWCIFSCVINNTLMRLIFSGNIPRCKWGFFPRLFTTCCLEVFGSASADWSLVLLLVAGVYTFLAPFLFSYKHGAWITLSKGCCYELVSPPLLKAVVEWMSLHRWTSMDLTDHQCQKSCCVTEGCVSLLHLVLFKRISVTRRQCSLELLQRDVIFQ